METALDVEWSHTMAPKANIALVLAADNSGTNLDLAELFAIETGLGPVISNSWGIIEYAPHHPRAKRTHCGEQHQ